MKKPWEMRDLLSRIILDEVIWMSWRRRSRRELVLEAGEGEFMSVISPIRLNAVPSANPGPTGPKQSANF